MKRFDLFRTTLAADIKAYLSGEEFKLYELIWKRTISCQMLHATLDTIAVDLTCADGLHSFRANGSSIKDPGFMIVYLEGKDDKQDQPNEASVT